MSVVQEYHFDEVFGNQTTQSDLFVKSGVQNMVQRVLEGYNATVFAYGQTGSGKTFTMEGYNYESVTAGSKKAEVAQIVRPKVNLDTSAPEELGLVPRTINSFYAAIAKMAATGKEISVQCSFLQIYNEQIYDLLNPGHLRLARNQTNNANSQGLRLRWTTRNEEGFYVEGLMIKECKAADDVLGQFHKGIQNKIMASHTMNAASSRSHCLFTLHLTTLDPNNPSGAAIRSKFCLVDLAGSERASQTQATGNVLRESIGINKSLFVLRKVIDTVVLAAAPGGGKAKEHIPYRDSKLTSLLKQSLGGNSMTLMIACLSPSDSFFEENMSTLTYASKASSISNDPVKNEDPQTRLIRKLKKDLGLLKQQLSQAHNIREVVSVEVCPKCRQNMSDAAASAPQQPLSPPKKKKPQTTDTEESVALPHKSGNQPAEAPSIQASPLKKEKSQSIGGRTAERNTGDRKMVRSRPSAQATSDHLIKTKEFEKELSSMKKDTLGHVQLIKQMFQVEQQIRNQLDEESDGKAQAERQNRELNIENRELRERIEVLEYLTVGELADTISGGGQPQTGQKAAKFSQRVLDDVMTTACARIAGDIHPNKASELQVELDGVRQENKSLGQENKSLGAQLKQMNDKVEKLKQSQRAALPLTPQSPRDAARGKRTSSGAAKKFTPGRRRDRQKEMDSTSNSSDVRGTTKATRTKRNGGRNVSSKQPSSEAGSSGVLTVDELKRLLSGGSGSSGPSEKKRM
jgi:regulator of replication initiation timing